jgi:hypothetical protein
VRRPLLLAVRAVVAVGLGVDAYVHLHLASRYQLAAPDGIGGGTLFRIEGVLAVIALLLVLVRPRASSFALAALVALGGVAAVVLYRYVDVGAIGPVPSMYEPIWFPEKSLSALAEAAAAILALVGLLLDRGSSSPRRRPGPGVSSSRRL